MQNYKRIGLNNQQKQSPEPENFGFNFAPKPKNQPQQQQYQNIQIQNFAIQNLNDQFALPNCVVRPIQPKMDRVSSANLSKKMIKNIQSGSNVKQRKNSYCNYNYNYNQRAATQKQQAEISEQLLKNNFMNNSDFASAQLKQKKQTFQNTKNQANKFFNHQKYRDIQTATYQKKNQLQQLKNYDNDNNNNLYDYNNYQFNNNLTESENNDNNQNNYSQNQNQNQNQYYNFNADQNNNFPQNAEIFPDFQEIAEKQRARTANFSNNAQRQKLENLKNLNANNFDEQNNSSLKQGPQQINKVQIQQSGNKCYNFYNYGNNQNQEKEEYETFKVNKDVRSHFQKFLRPKSQYSFSQCQTAATLTEKHKIGHWSQKNRNNLESAGSSHSRISEFSQSSQISEARKKLRTAGAAGQRKTHTITNLEKYSQNSKKQNRPQTQQQHGRKTLQQRQNELISLLNHNNNLVTLNKEHFQEQDILQKKSQLEEGQENQQNQNQSQNQQNQNQNQSQKLKQNQRIPSLHQKSEKRTTFQDQIQENQTDFMNNFENEVLNDSYQKNNSQQSKFQNSQQSRVQTSVSRNRDSKRESLASGKKSNQQTFSKFSKSGSAVNNVIKPALKNTQQQQQYIDENPESDTSLQEVRGFDLEIEGITEKDIQYIHQERKKQREFEKKSQANYEQNKIFEQNLKNKILHNEKQLQKKLAQNCENIEKNQEQLGNFVEEENQNENENQVKNEKENENQIEDEEEDSFSEKVILQQIPDKFKEFTDFYDNDQNMIEKLKEQEQEYRKKFEIVKQEDQAMIEEINQNKHADLDFLEGQKFLSFQEIDSIKKEFNRPVNARNYYRLDEIVQKLKFFEQFSKHTRIYLLKLANIVEYQSNINIFHQGDEGDLMYIIIKGAVHVRIQQEQPDGKIENPVVVTLYDGTQFGELALNTMEKKQNKGLQKILNDGQPVKDLKTVRKLLEESEKQQLEEEEQKKKLQRLQQSQDYDEENNLDDLAKEITHQKRAATIQTCEPTILFTISKQQYQSIVVNMMKRDLDDKLKILKTIQFLDYFNAIQLITLAKHIEVQKHTLGDIILKEGEVPKYFYIIAKGRVKIVKEEIFVRKNELLGQGDKQQQKRFNFSLLDYKNVVKDKIYKKHEIAKFQEFDVSSDEERLRDEQIMNKTDQYQKIYQNEQELMFKYQFDFGTLSQSEFFMGRAFLQEYLKVDPRFQSELGKKNVHEKAKLSVIADSAEVEIYKIDKTKIYEMPEMIKKVLISGLASKKEYDWEYDDKIEVNLNQDSNSKNDSKISFNQFMMANFGKKWQRVWENYKQELLQSQLEEKRNKKNVFNR